MKFSFKESKLLTRVLPVLVWVSAAVAVSVLFLHQSETAQLKGIAFSHEQTINSVETGYLRSIAVSLYQEVKKGDTLAVIKENTVAREEYVDAMLQARRTTAEAELEQLKAELTAAEDRLLIDQFERDSDTTSLERRLAVDLERARLEVLEIRSTLEPDRLTLKDLQVEIEIVNRLVSEQATEEYELQKAQTQYDILKEKVDQTQALLDQAQTNYELAQLRKDELDQKIPVSPLLSDRELAPIRKAILVQEKRIAELIKQRGIIVLTAPFDGIVNTLNYKPGQTVVRGDTIMTIVQPTPDSITAWIPQKNIGQFARNMKVKVVSLNAPRQTFISQISNMSPSLELIPQQLWRNPTVPEWGRSIQVPVQPSFACIHNEIVGITTILQ
ncbi:MAG: HlyD family efflux transporter periplasmic adaptor subunit [Planctomycetes bacterium]|nr:HlyD family efflux transporter periplasmic adaptor subunit [Planctomycetota bacterium]